MTPYARCLAYSLPNAYITLFWHSQLLDPRCLYVNPQYTYLSLGCSQAAEQRMLNFARGQVGKPFSNMGMARSLVWPRPTDHKTYYCAELVAAILKQGGLMYAALHTQTPRPSLLRLFFCTRAHAPCLTRIAVLFVSLLQEPRQQPRCSDALQSVQAV